jgi:hypothetical protein
MYFSYDILISKYNAEVDKSLKKNKLDSFLRHFFKPVKLLVEKESFTLILDCLKHIIQAEKSEYKASISKLSSWLVILVHVVDNQHKLSDHYLSLSKVISCFKDSNKKFLRHSLFQYGDKLQKVHESIFSNAQLPQKSSDKLKLLAAHRPNNYGTFPFR